MNNSEGPFCPDNRLWKRLFLPSTAMFSTESQFSDSNQVDKKTYKMGEHRNEWFRGWLEPHIEELIRTVLAKTPWSDTLHVGAGRQTCRLFISSRPPRHWIVNIPTSLGTWGAPNMSYRLLTCLASSMLPTSHSTFNYFLRNRLLHMEINRTTPNHEIITFLYFHRSCRSLVHLIPIANLWFRRKLHTSCQEKSVIRTKRNFGLVHLPMVWQLIIKVFYRCIAGDVPLISSLLCERVGIRYRKDECSYAPSNMK